jgi:hypothetical protein
MFDCGVSKREFEKISYFTYVRRDVAGELYVTLVEQTCGASASKNLVSVANLVKNHLLCARPRSKHSILSNPNSQLCKSAVWSGTTVKHWNPGRIGATKLANAICGRVPNLLNPFWNGDVMICSPVSVVPGSNTHAVDIIFGTAVTSLCICWTSSSKSLSLNPNCLMAIRIRLVLLITAYHPHCMSLHSLPPFWRMMTGMLGEVSGGDVKAWRVFWQIAVRVPANPDVTKLERSGEAATHLDSYSVPGPSSTVIVMSKYRVTSRLADIASADIVSLLPSKGNSAPHRSERHPDDRTLAGHT